jgi:hypothetical protein
MTTAQARVHVQAITRAFLRDAVRAQRVAAAEVAFVHPVREAADESEAAP